jgi:hypothetical protein
MAQDYNSEEAQKAWQEAMTPGEMHAMLAKAAGTWKAKIMMWNDPESEPMVSEGTVESEMILGGRYLQSKHTGTYMGMPMNGFSIEGYDNVKKKFINTWVDNFGTGIMISEGEYDPEKKEVVYYGKYTDPMSGGDIKTRQVMKMIDDDHSVFEMYMNMNGQEFKSMVVEYTKM